jgi:molybdate transport system substrate-binding protein
VRRALLLCVAALLAGCGGDDGGAGGAPLDVFAASSLRDVLPEVDAGPTYTFAGSDELAAQIRDGAAADLFLSASAAPVRELREAELVEEPVAFASNRLVVVVPAGDPAGISSFEGLARGGVKLVLGGDGVPVGDYAREALAAAALEAALDNVVSLEQDVKGVLGKVALGEADAGIVYATDVAAADDDVEAIEIPEAVQPEVRYYGAVVSGGDEDAARELLDRLAAADGAEALRAGGFLPLEP